MYYINVATSTRILESMSLIKSLITHLTARVQLIKHVPELYVPKSDMLVLCPSTRREDTRHMRVPCKCFDRSRMLVELPQWGVTWRHRCDTRTAPTFLSVPSATSCCWPSRTPYIPYAYLVVITSACKRTTIPYA